MTRSEAQEAYAREQVRLWSHGYVAGLLGKPRPSNDPEVRKGWCAGQHAAQTMDPATLAKVRASQPAG